MNQRKTALLVRWAGARRSVNQRLQAVHGCREGSIRGRRVGWRSNHIVGLNSPWEKTDRASRAAQACISSWLRPEILPAKALVRGEAQGFLRFRNARSPRRSSPLDRSGCVHLQATLASTFDRQETYCSA